MHMYVCVAIKNSLNNIGVDWRPREFGTDKYQSTEYSPISSLTRDIEKVAIYPPAGPKLYFDSYGTYC